MAAVDSYIPQPERPIDQPFLMPVEDVFSISGRGTRGDRPCRARGVIKVRRGNRNRRSARTPRRPSSPAVEMFRKLLDQGQAGDKHRARCCVAPSARKSSAARAVQARFGQAAHQVQG